MDDIVRFQVVSQIDGNEVVEIFREIYSKKHRRRDNVFKALLIVSIFMLTSGFFLEMYDCINMGIENITNSATFNIIVCAIFIPISLVLLINIDKIRMSRYTKKFFKLDDNFTTSYKLSFYEDYYIIEGSDKDTTTYIKMSYELIDYVSINEDVILIGNSSKAISCIKKDKKFQVGTWEDFSTFLECKFKYILDSL